MIAVYPGSFDPLTFGHIDIIQRASSIVDKLYVAVLNNSSKKFLYTDEERIIYLKEHTKNLENVVVKTFSGLLVEFAKQNNINAVIRGLRTVTDFNYEFQMALANRELNSDIETLFMVTNSKYLYLSSSVVKEVAAYGGNIDEMVPDDVKISLLKKLKEE